MWKRIITSIFPNARSYSNFIMMILFIMITYANIGNKTIVLIGGLGGFYSLNEWGKTLQKRDKE